MAITNNASYIPTMNEFLAHWALVNAALPAAPLEVLNSKGQMVDRAQFELLRSTLEDRNTAVIDALNDQQIARGEIELLKPKLLLLLNEFNDMIAAYWHQTGFLNARPKAPSVSDGRGRFLEPMVDVSRLWLKLNAAAPPPGAALPLVLSNGMTQAGFQQLVQNLTLAYQDEKNALVDVVLARNEREITKAAAYDVMKCYRVTVEGRCRALPALLASLPRLTPAENGHTPDAVNASAVFEAPDKAKVVYDASTDADLDHYELRGNPGAEFSDEDAVVVASNAPEALREFLSSFGLNQPGAQVSYKVYVVLNTGNEAGSAAMTVTRPV